ILWSQMRGKVTEETARDQLPIPHFVGPLCRKGSNVRKIDKVKYKAVDKKVSDGRFRHAVEPLEEIPRDQAALRRPARMLNPKGLRLSAQGCELASYPGFAVLTTSNPVSLQGCRPPSRQHPG